MSQAYNLGKFANTLNTSGQIDATTGITGTFPTTNLPTIPINKGGTNLTTVGANGTILGTDGSAYTYGSASGALTWDTVKTSSFTAVAGYGYLVNTTSSTITVTLPASPTIGQTVVIVDYAGTAATNNITVATNGSVINGAGNVLIQTNREALTLVYINSTQGWLSQSNVYKSGAPFTQPIVAQYLVVAGGGSGGSRAAGGGGAGGLLTGSATLTSGQSYTITIGGGGAAVYSMQAGNGKQGIQGSNSVFSGSGITTQTAIGGGGGGAYTALSATSGGSGGGGFGVPGTGSSGASGTSGQGYAGGNGANNGYNGGGGGGAGGVGSAGLDVGGGNGGVGYSSSITGTATYYAGGGGGASDATGGSGGGGNAGAWPNGNGSAGTANTGGGGGGARNASDTTNVYSGAGGSGVIILSIPTTQYTGTITGSPTVTTSGSNTILKYTASGTYTA